MKTAVVHLIISLVTAPMTVPSASFVATKSESWKAMTDEVNSSLTYNPLVVKGVLVFRLENHQLDAIIVENQGKT